MAKCVSSALTACILNLRIAQNTNHFPEVDSRTTSTNTHMRTKGCGHTRKTPTTTSSWMSVVARERQEHLRKQYL